MIQLRFVPIDQWPGERTKNRKFPQFRSTYPQTLDLLEQELVNLRAKEIVLQAFIGWEDIRNDGVPKSSANFRDPGVILTFETKNGTLSFPCDTYTDWQSNLRAIALSLEALRSVNRYGVTRRNEQYQGWRQLATSSGKPFPNKEAAAIYLSGHAGNQPGGWHGMVADSAMRQQAYRRAAAKLHPDAPGGSHDEFVRLQAALAMLEAR